MANRELDSSYFLDGHMREVSVPTDLLWGESDRLLPLEYAEKMQKELPNGRITRIPRCGHVPQVECPQSFLQALQQALNRPPTALPRADAVKEALKER
jgi:pimeloyl-ACP methyl ester carboxylesterase